MCRLFFSALCQRQASGLNTHHPAPPAPQAAAINAQQLARAPDGLPLLLSLLEPEPAGLADFYARYHTLQVLKGLVAAAPLALQQVGPAAEARAAA